MQLDDVRIAIEDIRETLTYDGYDLSVNEEDGVIALTVTAGPEACADCLIPRGTFVDLVSVVLQEHGVHLDPADLRVVYRTQSAL